MLVHDYYNGRRQEEACGREGSNSLCAITELPGFSPRRVQKSNVHNGVPTSDSEESAFSQSRRIFRSAAQEARYGSHTASLQSIAKSLFSVRQFRRPRGVIYVRRWRVSASRKEEEDRSRISAAHTWRGYTRLFSQMTRTGSQHRSHPSGGRGCWQPISWPSPRPQALPTQIVMRTVIFIAAF